MSNVRKICKPGELLTEDVELSSNGDYGANDAIITGSPCKYSVQLQGIFQT